MLDVVVVIIFSVLGVLLAALLVCVPRVHLYTLLGVLSLATVSFAGDERVVVQGVTLPLFAGLIVGYAVFNMIPSILLSAADESALLAPLPDEQSLIKGRGYKTLMLSALGGLAGILILLIIFGFPLRYFLGFTLEVLSTHFHWIVWCMICFMLMSEGAQSGIIVAGGWGKLFDAWQSTGVGLITFLLSGFLGFILFYAAPLPVVSSFQNFVPALIGLFTVPSLIMSRIGRFESSVQPYSLDSTDSSGVLLKGMVTGVVGGVMLLFLLGVAMISGGATTVINGFYVPFAKHDYYMVLAAVSIAGATACLLLRPFTKVIFTFTDKSKGSGIPVAACVVVLVVVILVATGGAGRLVVLAATGIGLLPLLFGVRRVNCLGVILLPSACMMSGCGATVAAWLGLL